MNASGTTLRIAVVTAIPTPYRDPFWNVLASLPGITLDVIYCAKQKGDRPWKISWEQQYNAHYPKVFNLASRFGVAASCYWNPEIRTLFRQQRYDGVIVGGYNHPTMLWVMQHARRHRIPYFLTCESYLAQKRAPWKHWVKEWLVRRIVSQARGCMPTGKLASEYLVHYGALPKNLCLVPNIPDVKHFHQRATELAPNRSELRQTFKLTRKSILFVGRFIEMKGGHHLIQAFRKLRQNWDAELILLGGGPQKSSWEALAAECGVGDFVRFPGFQPPEALPEWFAAADLMCLPSTNETWSVVVLEALSSGLPVVITDRVGCYANAITNDQVGEVVHAGDVQALHAGLDAQLTKSVPRDSMFELWQSTRESFDYDVVAQRLAKALRDWCFS